MKALNFVFIGLLSVLLVAVPVAAEAHGGFGAGAVFGLGLGFLTGLALAPAPVYVAPPVYYPTPPLAYGYYPSYYGPALSSSNVPPAGYSRCREWRVINRHWENRWDPYYGRWRAVLVEKWGWGRVPCNN